MQNPHLPPGCRQDDIDDPPRRSAQVIRDERAYRGQQRAIFPPPFSKREHIIMCLASGHRYSSPFLA